MRDDLTSIDPAWICWIVRCEPTIESVVNNSAPRPSLVAQKDTLDRGARVAIEIADDPIRFLAAIQVGTTLRSTMLVGTLSGAILALKLAAWLGDYAAIRPYSTTIAISVLIVATTWLSMVLAELVPKQIALKYPEPIAARVALPISYLVRAPRADGLGTGYFQQLFPATDAGTADHGTTGHRGGHP